MEWRCARCGAIQDEDDPPCDECGFHGFERVPGGDESSPSDPVWVCPECGRQHQKNSPPCKRCGHVHLEQREPDYEAFDDIGGTTYRDVLEPRYVAGFVFAGLLGAVLVLGVAGVITLPGTGPPEPPEAPAGDAAGLNLSAVESAYVTALNAQRSNAGVGEVSRAADVDAVATYYNKRVVEARYGDAELPDQEEMNQFDARCGEAAAFVPYSVDSDRPLAEYDERGLANELVGALANPERVTVESQSRVGVDVHVAPDQRVFVTALVC
ncbi:hypothetical protein [Halomicrobium salinisoli]|uniref:hypothetical protein n=1 Tax=Halomicrobium salinisoli TaxID=2878391 RepID=UPI001CF073FC|nr:hypothetical protein [Halomicrobium salinisoli]